MTDNIEPRHNCLAGEHYPKQIPTYWTNEQGKPSEPSNRLIGHLLPLIPVLFIGVTFMWTFGTVDMNPFAIGDMVNIDEVKEQKRQLLFEIRAMPCDEQAVKLAGNEWSTSGLISDSYYANQEYRYLCLGVDRPTPPEVNHDPRNSR